MKEWLPSFLDEVKVAASQGRLTIPKSRSGRRPMSVETLLRKEKEGTLYKDAAAITDQTSAVYQESEPNNPTLRPKLQFLKGDVPSREDIPGRTTLEMRNEMSGAVPLGRGLTSATPGMS